MEIGQKVVGRRLAHRFHLPVDENGKPLPGKNRYTKIRFQITEGPDVGKIVDFYKSLVGKSIEQAKRAFIACGWDGKSKDSFRTADLSQTVMLTLEREQSYETETGEKKPGRFCVAFVDPLLSAKNAATPKEEDEILDLFLGAPEMAQTEDGRDYDPETGELVETKPHPSTSAAAAQGGAS